MVEQLYSYWLGLWQGMQGVISFLSYEINGTPVINIIFGTGITVYLGALLIFWLVK